MKEDKRVELENGCYRIDSFYGTELLFVNYYDSDGKLHRDGNKVASIEYHDNGKIASIEFHIHGINARTDNEPSNIKYNEDGSLLMYAFTDADGKSHYKDGTEPCSIYYHDGEIYEVCYCIHGDERQADPTKAWWLEYWENKIATLTYKDGDSEYSVNYSNLSDDQKEYYHIDNIKPYQVKEQEF